MTDRKPPVAQALALLLYAPLGLVLTAAEEVPKLVEKGRTQAGMYRLVGQFAVNEGQQRAGRILRQTQGLLRDRAGTVTPPARPAPSPTSTASAPPSTPATRNGASGNGASGNGAAPGPATARPSSEALAIPAYDTLSAPQVVQRLAGLSAAELESVRAYEAATRGRKTILNRVDQLQSGA